MPWNWNAWENGIRCGWTTPYACFYSMDVKINFLHLISFNDEAYLIITTPKISWPEADYAQDFQKVIDLQYSLVT
jgi:hypothetical protein